MTRLDNRLGLSPRHDVIDGPNRKKWRSEQRSLRIGGSRYDDDDDDTVELAFEKETDDDDDSYTYGIYTRGGSAFIIEIAGESAA